MRMPVTRATVGLVLAGLLVFAGPSTSFAGVLPDVGIDYGSPLGVSVYADVAFASDNPRPSVFEEHRRWFPCVGGQLGFGGGGSLSMGLVRPIVRGGLVHWRPRASLTFTGGSPLLALPRSTYAGLHLDIGIPWAARLHAGVETRIGAGRRDTRLTWGVSVSPAVVLYIIFADSRGPFPGC
jgi:hypothetical protein